MRRVTHLPPSAAHHPQAGGAHSLVALLACSTPHSSSSSSSRGGGGAACLVGPAAAEMAASVLLDLALLPEAPKEAADTGLVAPLCLVGVARGGRARRLGAPTFQPASNLPTALACHHLYSPRPT